MASGRTNISWAARQPMHSKRRCIVYKAEHVVRTKEEIQAMLGEMSENQANKRIDHIDQHCRTWIERTPFIVISTSSLAGYMDVSPKGDTPGFVKVLDENTLAIPDRPGN